jgi:hypothetical protein
MSRNAPDHGGVLELSIKILRRFVPLYWLEMAMLLGG